MCPICNTRPDPYCGCSCGYTQATLADYERKLDEDEPQPAGAGWADWPILLFIAACTVLILWCSWR